MNMLLSILLVTIVYMLSINCIVMVVAIFVDDVDAFHMPFFTSELEKLRLPNQQMSFSVHTIDALEESSLHMGINACRRYAVVKSHTNGGGSITSAEKMFLSSECLWRHFQHIDDASRDAATWLKRHPDSLFSNTQHLVRG